MKKPNVNIFQVSVIPPNIEDNTTAVVIYLDISISHLPNSFFITLVFWGKGTLFFPFHQILGGFSRHFRHVIKSKSDELREELSLLKLSRGEDVTSV